MHTESISLLAPPLSNGINAFALCHVLRQPAIVEIQILRVGQLAILCVPGELTTMAGRRLREAVQLQVMTHCSIAIQPHVRTQLQFLLLPAK